MGSKILAGQILVAGTSAGELNQYYGLADTSQTTVLTATMSNLSTPYVIPPGEVNYAGATYELTCGGSGTWGSTQESLRFGPYVNGVITNTPGVAAAAIPASTAFTWNAKLTLVCADGTGSWWVTFSATVQESATLLNPGTPSSNSIALAGANASAASAPVSSGITVAVQAQWGATTGAPTVTNTMTTFRKIA